MIYEDAAAIDLRIMRGRFAGVVADWRLTQSEVRSLLGIEFADEQTEVLPASLDRAMEARMRLLIDLERAISSVMDDLAAAAWFRQPNPAYGGLSPLAAASADVVCLRGMRANVTMARCDVA